LPRLAVRVGRAAVEFVFPARCVSCGATGSFVCDACRATLTPASPPRCTRCWSPGDDLPFCASCERDPPAYHRLRAAFVYRGVARELVHALKFRGMSTLGAPMGRLLAEALDGYGIEPALIVPVPLAGMRRRTRGYNQAETLARALGSLMGAPVEARALKRTRNTSPQARSADALTRRRNVASAFEARPQHVAGRSVLLVDDVTTTGATLDACARALLEAGAARVWAAAFARED
jgi:ComF family protein